jgi:hypothetical protein
MINVFAENNFSNLSFEKNENKKNINVFANTFYWYPSETFDWAFTLDASEKFTKSSYKSFTFDWAFGFLVGLGYNLKDDKWDLKLNYKWFESKARDKTNGSITPAFLAARLALLEPFENGNAKVDLKYSMFDLDLNYNYFVSKYISFKPTIGLKGGWINQDIFSNWRKFIILNLFPVSAFENLKQRFQTGGVNAGCSINLFLVNTQKNSFSWIADMESSFLWGHWSIKDKYFDNFSTVIKIKTQNRNFGSFMLKSFMGFGWDYKFNHNQSHFKLKFGYELEDWFNHLQIFSDTSGSQNNNLIFQGVNLGLHLNF